MGNVKLIVIYPCPKDIESFERVYKNEHVPMAVEKFDGKTKIVASKIVGSPQGTPPFHRIAEIHFPSMEALQAAPHRTAANRRSRMQWQFLPAAHRFSWSPKRKPLCSWESE